jgi:hypothetical protein
MLDVVIIVSERRQSVSRFLEDRRESIASYQHGTMKGRLKDGRSFLVVRHDHHMVTRLQGLIFREYELFDREPINAYERSFLDASIRQ